MSNNLLKRFKLFTDALSTGGGGINYRSINASKLQWESQYNGSTHDSSIASGEVVPRSSFVQGDFVGVMGKILSGAATASQILQFVISPNLYHE